LKYDNINYIQSTTKMTTFNSNKNTFFASDQLKSEGTSLNLVGTKRLRPMRSMQGGVQNETSGQRKPKKSRKNGKQNYHDRKTDPPMFIQKTYEMINTCDATLASWTDDGTMFIIKDQERFAEEVIPKFFTHKNFNSFTRQLHYYRFRKLQLGAIYKDDVNSENAKHFVFMNPKFQRGKPELLTDIQRSTKGDGYNEATYQEQQNEIMLLKQKVMYLESMNEQYNNRLMALEFRLLNSENEHKGVQQHEKRVRKDSPSLSSEEGGEEEEGNMEQAKGTSLSKSISNSDSSEGIKLLRGLSNTSIGSFRGFSNTSIGGLLNMSSFEQKYVQGALLGQNGETNSRSSSLPRQLSDPMSKFGMNDLPRLSTGV